MEQKTKIVNGVPDLSGATKAKIELIVDLPIDPKCEAKAGKQYDAEIDADGNAWIVVATGQKARAFARQTQSTRCEFKIIEGTVR